MHPSMLNVSFRVLLQSYQVHVRVQAWYFEFLEHQESYKFSYMQPILSMDHTKFITEMWKYRCYNPSLRACCAEAVISSASCNSRQSNTLMVSFSTGSFKPDDPGSNNPAAIHWKQPINLLTHFYTAIYYNSKQTMKIKGLHIRLKTLFRVEPH